MAVRFSSSINITGRPWTLPSGQDGVRFLVSHSAQILNFLDLKTWRLNIEIVDDSEMKKLNQDHRGKDAVTDILSFPTFSNLYIPGRLPPRRRSSLGELILAPEFITREWNRLNEGEVLPHGVQARQLFKR